MKQLLAALLLIAAPLAAQDASINKDGSGGSSGGGGGALADITDLAAGCVAFLQTPSSANLATCVSDETGSSLSVFRNSPALITPSVFNGATSAGSILFKEDTDNGTNAITLIGQSSVADVTITMPGSTGTMTLDDISNAWADGVKQTFNPDGTNAGINVGSQAGNPSAHASGDLWYNSLRGGGTFVSQLGAPAPIAGGGANYVRVADDFVCGAVTAVSSTIGSCTGLTGLLANSATTTAGVAVAGHPGVANLNTVNSATGNALLGSTGVMLIEPGTRQKWIIKTPDLLSTTANTYVIAIGACDCTGSGLGTNGVFFRYTNDDGNATPNWQMTIKASSAGSTTVDSGVTFAADTWVTLEWWYESVGAGVHFYINGTETSNSPAVATNIPDTAGDDARGFFAKVQKSTGTNAPKILLVDYADLTIPLPSR